eukprot:13483687-Heterocapsa_arctica.AAC.1
MQNRGLRHNGVEPSYLLQQVCDVDHQLRNRRLELVNLHVERLDVLGLPFRVCPRVENSMSH